MHQRLVDAGKLDGVEAGKRNQRFGRDRVLLVRHRRRAAAAGKLDLVAGLRQQGDVLAELAEAAGDQRKQIGEIGDRRALALPLRRVGKAKFLRKGSANAGRGVAELFERAGGAAELDAETAARSAGRDSASRGIAPRTETVAKR